VLSSAPDHYVGRHLDRVPVTSEFVLEVKLRRLAGPPEEWFGLEFGQSFPGNYYQFLLNGDGVVHVSKHFGEVWTPLLDRAGLRYVHCEGQQNQLMVVRHDRLLHLFVNERHVVTLEDFDIRSGTPGLMIGRGIRVEFSDLQAAGISLESVFNEALSHWRELEIKKAKQVLDYVARYDPSFSAGGWPNASQLIREVQPDRGETVLIAIGQTMLPQLNDRGPAERLRDAINRKGRGLPFRWATIVTDSALLRDEVYCRCPIISVGGPLVNQFTERLGHSQRENPRSSAGVHIQCSTIPGERHVALWGDRPNETAVAVDTYMSSELLDGYLASIWGT
jgi:hypothetical protein